MTIEPGTRFVMDQRAQITFSEGSSLQAVGTEAEPIVLTGLESTPGFWNGLRFFRSGGSTVQHARIEWAGGSPDGLTRGSIFAHRSGGTGVIRLLDVVVRGSSTCAVFASEAGEQRVEVDRFAVAEHNGDFLHLCGPFPEPAGLP